MKICWDNLEKLRYSKRTGKWYRGSSTFVYRECCKECSEPFLADYYANIKFCSVRCSQIGNSNSFYGKNHSEYNKEKWSRKKSGKNNLFYGKNHTKESLKKISAVHKGKKITEECKKKLSIALSGENNPNWKGGLSYKEYCVIWKSKEFRDFIYERDKSKFCWNPQCEGKGIINNLHHIDYNKKNCNPDNVIKLCNSCNSQANFNRGWWKSFYTEVMRRKGVVSHV